MPRNILQVVCAINRQSWFLSSPLWLLKPKRCSIAETQTRIILYTVSLVSRLHNTIYSLHLLADR